MAANRVNVVFGADASELTNALRQIQDQFAALTSGTYTWANAFDLISSTADRVLQGVLTGTQTWQQAMTRIFDDLAVSFIEKFSTETLLQGGFALLGSPGSGVGGLLGGLLGGGGDGLGALGALAMFQDGAWSIPRDMIAMVHEGEMILPAEVAGRARGGGAASPFPASAGGAGLTLNVNVQALDSQDVARWANTNAKTLAATITRYMSSNPSSRAD
jgi:hypothetical protein